MDCGKGLPVRVKNFMIFLSVSCRRLFEKGGHVRCGIGLIRSR